MSEFILVYVLMNFQESHATLIAFSCLVISNHWQVHVEARNSGLIYFFQEFQSKISQKFKETLTRFELNFFQIYFSILGEFNG